MAMTLAKLEMFMNLRVKKNKQDKIDKQEMQIWNPKEGLSNVSVIMYLLMHI